MQTLIFFFMLFENMSNKTKLLDCRWVSTWFGSCLAYNFLTRSLYDEAVIDFELFCSLMYVPLLLLFLFSLINPIIIIYIKFVSWVVQKHCVVFLIFRCLGVWFFIWRIAQWDFVTAAWVMVGCKISVSVAVVVFFVVVVPDLVRLE